MLPPKSLHLAALVLLLTGDLQFGHRPGNADGQNLPVSNDCVTVLVATFENDLSGFVQSHTDHVNWTRAKGSTPTSFTGPHCDRTTLGANGHFLYLEEDSTKTGQYADILSPEINVPANRYDCKLKFSFSMYGSDIGNLSVLPFWNNRIHANLWSASSQQMRNPDTWMDVLVSLVAIPVDKFKIVFRATSLARDSGSTFSQKGDIAIDNVIVRCCVGCRVTLRDTQDFEGQGGKKYAQSTQDDFNWTRKKGATGSRATGPDGDHTGTQDQWWCGGFQYSPDGTGYYMYTEATNQKAGERATMFSPAYNMTANETCYISFWYNMYGDRMGELHVGTTLSPSLWCRNGEQTLTAKWLHGHFWFFSEVAQTFKVNITGVMNRTGSSYRGDMAIDDISVTCCQSDGVIQLPISTFECNTDNYLTAGNPRWKWYRGVDHTTMYNGWYLHVSRGPQLSPAQNTLSIIHRTYDVYFPGKYDCSLTAWIRSYVTASSVLSFQVNNDFAIGVNAIVAGVWQGFTVHFKLNVTSFSGNFTVYFIVFRYAMSLSIDDIAITCFETRPAITTNQPATSEQPTTTTSILSAPITTSPVPLTTSLAASNTPSVAVHQTFSSALTASSTMESSHFTSNILTEKTADVLTKSTSTQLRTVRGSVAITTAPESQDKGSSSAVGVAVGAAAGGMLLLLVAVVVLCYVRRHQRRYISSQRSMKKETSRTAILADGAENWHIYEDINYEDLELSIFRKTERSTSSSGYVDTGVREDTAYVDVEPPISAQNGNGYGESAPTGQTGNQGAENIAGHIGDCDDHDYACLSHVSPPTQPTQPQGDEYSTLDRRRKQRLPTQPQGSEYSTLDRCQKQHLPTQPQGGEYSTLDRRRKHLPTQPQGGVYSTLDRHRKQCLPTQPQANECSTLDCVGRQSKSSSQGEDLDSHTSQVNHAQESAKVTSGDHVPEQPYSTLSAVTEQGKSTETPLENDHGAQCATSDTPSQPTKVDYVPMCHTGADNQNDGYAMLNANAPQLVKPRTPMSTRPVRVPSKNHLSHTEK